MFLSFLFMIQTCSQCHSYLFDSYCESCQRYSSFVYVLRADEDHSLVVTVPLFKALARPQKDSITWMHISTLASYSHSHSWLYISIISPINMTLRISSKCILYCLFISRLITFFIPLNILFIIVYILSFYFVIFIF